MNWTYNKVCPIDNMYSAYNSKSSLKARQNKANSKRIYLLSLQYQCLSLFSHLPWTASQSMVALHSPGKKTQLQFLFSYMTTWLIEYEPLPHCILSMFSTRTCQMLKLILNDIYSAGHFEMYLLKLVNIILDKYYFS